MAKTKGDHHVILHVGHYVAYVFFHSVRLACQLINHQYFKLAQATDHRQALSPKYSNSSSSFPEQLDQGPGQEVFFHKHVSDWPFLSAFSYGILLRVCGWWWWF